MSLRRQTAGALGALLMAWPVAGALAQKAVKEPPAAPAPAPQPPPPYEPQLLRLSELMGALAYMRQLCGAQDASAFHDKMEALLNAPGETEARKEQLAGAYNRGFGDYALTYHACTPAAHEVITRFLDETARIARDLANRYGG